LAIFCPAWAKIVIAARTTTQIVERILILNLLPQRRRGRKGYAELKYLGLHDPVLLVD
jgi:hypothetical protein